VSFFCFAKRTTETLHLERSRCKVLVSGSSCVSGSSLSVLYKVLISWTSSGCKVLVSGASCGTAAVDHLSDLPKHNWYFGCGVQNLGFRVEGLGFRVESLEIRNKGSRTRDEGSGF